MLRVTRPSGSPVGSQIIVQDPSGRQFRARIPPGVAEGGVFPLRLKCLQSLLLSFNALENGAAAAAAAALFGSLASEGALSASGSLFSGHRHCHQPPLAPSTV